MTKKGETKTEGSKNKRKIKINKTKGTLNQNQQERQDIPNVDSIARYDVNIPA
jgi:hypothetical protein